MMRRAGGLRSPDTDGVRWQTGSPTSGGPVGRRVSDGIKERENVGHRKRLGQIPARPGREQAFDLIGVAVGAEHRDRQVGRGRVGS